MKKKLYFVILITFSLNNFSCDQDSQPLLIGYWNIENLFDLIDDPDKNDDEFSIGGRKNITQEIYELKLSHFGLIVQPVLSLRTHFLLAHQRLL